MVMFTQVSGQIHTGDEVRGDFPLFHRSHRLPHLHPGLHRRPSRLRRYTLSESRHRGEKYVWCIVNEYYIILFPDHADYVIFFLEPYENDALGAECV